MADSVGEALPREPTRMKFLLRSGNAFMVDGVVDWTIKRAPVTGRIVEVELHQLEDPRFARVIMETLDIAQIEGVLILPPNGPGRRANEKERGNE